MARHNPILRSALAGSALGVVVPLVRERGLGNLVARWTELDAYRSARDEDDDSFGPAWILILPAVGAGFGAACAVATRLLPIPPVAAGATVGTAMWAAVELRDRQRRARRGWPNSRPQFGAAATAAAYGAAVSWLINLRAADA